MYGVKMISNIDNFKNKSRFKAAGWLLFMIFFVLIGLYGLFVYRKLFADGFKRTDWGFLILLITLWKGRHMTASAWQRVFGSAQT
jgi:hypothetical protein